MKSTWLVWALLSAIFAGATAVFAKVGVKELDSNLATAIRTTVVVVCAWALASFTSRLDAMGAISARTWVFLGLSGLATALSWLCYFHALKLGPVSQVASIDKLSVVFVLIFAALFLNEPLTLKSGAGIGLVVAGAVLMAWKD